MISAKWWNAGALALALGAWLSTGCVVYDHPRPVSYYDYDYYPDWNVYYYPRTRVYYWNDEGHWRSGGRLPDRYVLHEDSRERIRSQTEQPWMEKRTPPPAYRYRGGGGDHDHDAR